MKRETLRHPKTLDLAARLGVERPVVLGILTLLWDFTAEVAPQGDIGKWPDGAIARACDYMGDHEAFVRSLVSSKWLDENHEHRLIVHDWPDHCERWVKSKLKAAGLWFLGCYECDDFDVSQDVSSDVGRDPPRDRTEPNRTEPEIPAGRWGGRPADGRDTGGDQITVDDAILAECLPEMQRIAEVIEPGKRLKAKDRELCIRAAVVAHKRFGRPWLDKVLKGISDRTQPPERPWGYFKSALAKSATRDGHDFHAAAAEIEIPPQYLKTPAIVNGATS